MLKCAKLYAKPYVKLYEIISYKNDFLELKTLAQNYYKKMSELLWHSLAQIDTTWHSLSKKIISTRAYNGCNLQLALLPAFMQCSDATGVAATRFHPTGSDKLLSCSALLFFLHIETAAGSSTCQRRLG